jgi:microcystin-dependent protein
MLAGMCVFAGNFAPRQYALAQGQILAINSNQALFSLLGTTYGGDGRTSFALPDMRGRVAISAGQSPGLSSYSLGQRGGQEAVTLTVQELPSHGHSASTTVTATLDNGAMNAGSSIVLKGIDQTGSSSIPTGNSLAIINARRSGYYSNVPPSVVMASETVSIDVAVANTAAENVITTINNNGGSQAHENRMPYIAMNWIIALQGIFPSRN